jgi:GT2 family glycosyltransferase
VYAAASQSLCDYLYAVGGAGAGEAAFFTTNNVAFDRATFESIGGFDESFPRAAGEDRDLGRRWRAAGGSLVYAADAIVDHAHGMGLPGFWRQQAAYGRGARQLHARMAAETDRGPRFSSAGFYTGLVVHPLRDGRPRPLARSALLALAQVATAWGYARERPR